MSSTNTAANKRKLTALTGYLEFVLDKFSSPEDGDEAAKDPYIMVLVCLQKALEVRLRKLPPNAKWLKRMKWAVVESERLLSGIYDTAGPYYKRVANWNPTTTPRNMMQNMCAWLMLVQHELHDDIRKSEAYRRNELKICAEDYARKLIDTYEAEQAVEGRPN